MNTEWLSINPRKVVHETIDGEAILIQLETGSYYSLEGSGPDILQLVDAGTTRQNAVSALESRYGANGGALASAIEHLIDELAAEELIEVGEEAPDGAGVEGEGPTADHNGGFKTPVLLKFTDLQELLLLDPIHEIDDSGWPNAPER
jgi:hypothetical protein